MEGVKRIGISDGVEVGIYKLDEIFKEIQALRIKNEDVLKEELLKRVKVNNYIPESREEEYKSALLEVYKNFYKKLRRQIPVGKTRKDY